MTDRFAQWRAPAHWQAVDCISDLHLQAGEAATFDAWCAWLARRKACQPYTAKKVAPAKAKTRASPGRSPKACAMPQTPAVISKASASAQNTTTAPTCSRRRPWRSTNAFCAPMATMRPRLKARPWAKTGQTGEAVTNRFMGHQLATNLT